MTTITSFEADISWVRPDQWLNAEQTRKAAVTALYAPLKLVIETAWRDEVPSKVWPEVYRRLGQGLRQGLTMLTVSHRHPHFQAYWHPVSCSWRLPSYWEPPKAAEPVFPPEQLQAYRWTAALIAVEVRNALEDIHSRHTSDESMPALNRGIRDAVYALLLSEPVLGWTLSEMPRVMVGLATLGLPVDIPAVAG